MIASLNLPLLVGRVPTGATPTDAPYWGKRLGIPAIMEGGMPELRRVTSFRDFAAQPPGQA